MGIERLIMLFKEQREIQYSLDESLSIVQLANDPFFKKSAYIEFKQLCETQYRRVVLILQSLEAGDRQHAQQLIIAYCTNYQEQIDYFNYIMPYMPIPKESTLIPFLPELAEECKMLLSTESNSFSDHIVPNSVHEEDVVSESELYLLTNFPDAGPFPLIPSSPSRAKREVPSNLYKGNIAALSLFSVAPVVSPTKHVTSLSSQDIISTAQQSLP